MRIVIIEDEIKAAKSLSDGLCFEIFRRIKISSPVIFCTAFGEYAMDAIKSNGVDYLLKPFSANELEAAFQKMDHFKHFFQQRKQSDWEELIKKLDRNEGKTSFLVFHNNRYITVRTAHIAYLYIKYDSPYMVTFQQQKYIIPQTLEQIQSQLSARQFYRLNRQYLINFDAIKEVEHYSSRKLALHLSVPTEEALLVGKEKITQFLQWMENR